MLDQNITTLLAALIGGLLSALGGFFANYYIQSTSEKIAKRKEIRNMTEQVFKETHKIGLEYLNINGNDNIGNLNHLKDSARKITLALNQIDYLVNFYLPPLKEDFTKYSKKFEGLLESMEHNDLSDFTDYISRSDLHTVSKIFQSSIIALYNKEGYNYF